MAAFRVGKSFADSVLCIDEQTARDELSKTPGAYAWKYYARARHWDLCNVDCRTGELFTVRDLENLNARGLLK